MNAAIARILLRYLAGILVTKGLLAPDVGSGLAVDPDVLNIITTIVGFGVMAVTESWYWFAKRFGWST